MTALLPWDGHQKGKEKEAARKRRGDEWWRWNGTKPAGRRGVKHAGQPQTDPDGREMSGPCVPPGTERFKVLR